MQPNLHLSKSDEYETLSPEDTLLYRSILGSLLYGVLGTRLDLAFTTAKLGQFNSCATQEH